MVKIFDRYSICDICTKIPIIIFYKKLKNSLQMYSKKGIIQLSIMLDLVMGLTSVRHVGDLCWNRSLKVQGCEVYWIFSTALI